MVLCSFKQIEESGRLRQTEIIGEARRLRRTLDAAPPTRAVRHGLPRPERGWLAATAGLCLTLAAGLWRVL